MKTHIRFVALQREQSPYSEIIAQYDEVSDLCEDKMFLFLGRAPKGGLQTSCSVFVVCATYNCTCGRSKIIEMIQRV